MSDAIGQRELRNDSGRIMRRVEQGESFVVTRNGRPVADLVPHARSQETSRPNIGELQAIFRQLAPVDVEGWRSERATADETFGNDDPVTG
ncbi:type II toxin-antitoxin system Phd/YefM family antitoxin [Actinomycetospora termitidis]|uniref:Antitoxin n=1 Tax=Actinomycetospora termitidis TaxID=3053470 RepID=A0ABT7MEE0_9PSEU|nr:type II toxin-antitoxin system prevent-host-death family antitoxin [Actinomycetospora sp. Odt1-22]MDL5159019.1 type II toxin-antitoxin system prevent-host-death family antitoxin [Actinomycetospora sp. Odt1-22]